MTIDPRRTLSLFGEEVVASRHALIQVLRAPDLRRIQMALVGYSLAEWASFIAISVYAFQIGGSAAVGVVAVVQLVPAALVAPQSSVTVFGGRRCFRSPTPSRWRRSEASPLPFSPGPR
jgi:hypothetical protein